MNRSEEEKKAVENLKHIIKHWKPHNQEDELANIEYNSIKIAVDLIEKQQKEIERLEKDLDKNFVYKYDIEEIINRHCPEVAIGKLEELLEEII